MSSQINQAEVKQKQLRLKQESIPRPFSNPSVYRSSTIARSKVQPCLFAWCLARKQDLKHNGEVSWVAGCWVV